MSIGRNEWLIPVAVVVGNVINLGIHLFMPRLLVANEYSHFVVLWAVGQFLVVLFYEWLRYATLRFSAAADESIASVRRTSLLQIYVAVSVFLLIISFLAFAVKSIWPPMLWVAVTGFYVVCRGTFEGSQALARAKFRNIDFAVSWMLRSVFSLIGALGFAIYFESGNLALLGLAVSFPAAMLFLGARKVGLRDVYKRPDKKQIAFLTEYGMFIAIAGMLSSLMPAAVRAATVFFLGSYAAGGLILALEITQRVIAALGMAVNITVLQRSIHSEEHGSGEARGGMLARQTALSAAFIFPAGIGLILLQPSVGAYIAPESYYDSYMKSVTLACLCATLLSFRSFGIDTLFVISGKPRLAALAPLMTLVLFGVLVGSSGSLVGFTGPLVLWSLLVALMGGILVSVITVKRVMTVKWPLRDLVIVVAGCIVMMLATYWIPKSWDIYHALATLVFGCISYGTWAMVFDLCGVRSAIDQRFAHLFGSKNYD